MMVVTSSRCSSVRSFSASSARVSWVRHNAACTAGDRCWNILIRWVRGRATKSSYRFGSEALLASIHASISPHVPSACRVRGVSAAAALLNQMKIATQPTEIAPFPTVPPQCRTTLELAAPERDLLRFIRPRAGGTGEHVHGEAARQKLRARAASPGVIPAYPARRSQRRLGAIAARDATSKRSPGPARPRSGGCAGEEEARFGPAGTAATAGPCRPRSSRRCRTFFRVGRPWRSWCASSWPTPVCCWPGFARP